MHPRSSATTTSALTSSSFLNASNFGTSVTFTDTLTSGTGVYAVGSVTFQANGVAIAGWCVLQ